MQKNKPRRRIIIGLSLLALTLVGCRPSFSEATQTAVALNPPTAPRAPWTPTPTVPTTPTIAPTADPAMAAYRGQNIFNGMGTCSTCHTTNGGRSLGPDLKGIGARLEAEGKDPAAYLHESIIDVMAVVAEGFRGDLMPQNYGTILTPEQINDLVEYMLTL